MQRKRKVQTKVQLQNARLPFVLAQARVGAGAGSGTEAEAEAAVSMATLTGPLTPSWPNLLLPSSVPWVGCGGCSGAAQLSAQFGADCQQEGGAGWR